MPVEELSPIDFLKKFQESQLTLIDSRSEGEYDYAHIPGALNIPLLNNNERKVVGTIHKQEGREAAVLKGFELVGPRFHSIAKEVLKNTPSKEAMLYCWRGGMRSSIMAWLLSTSGFKVTLLKGGYKSFRHLVLDINNTEFRLVVIGGPTGSGKTILLEQLVKAGEQVLNLEGLANHKGSAFGGIGQPPQPTNEHFENLIGYELLKFDWSQRIWIENESRTIGSCIVPENIYHLIRTSPLIDIEVGMEKRKKRITDDYGKIPFKILAETSEKLKKRLGPQNLKLALEYLENNDFESWLQIMIEYYDKLYNYGHTLRNPELILHLQLSHVNESDLAKATLDFVKRLNKNEFKVADI